MNQEGLLKSHLGSPGVLEGVGAQGYGKIMDNNLNPDSGSSVLTWAS